MAIIVVEGLILGVRQLDNGNTAFDLSENVGTKEIPQYNNYNCIGRFSENQLKHIYKDKIVEIVGDLKCVRVEKEGKTYFNLHSYVYNLTFKGEVKRDYK